MNRCPYFDILPTSKEDVWELVVLKARHIHTSFITLFIKAWLSFHDLIPICHAKDKRKYLTPNSAQQTAVFCSTHTKSSEKKRKNY